MVHHADAGWLCGVLRPGALRPGRATESRGFLERAADGVRHGLRSLGLRSGRAVSISPVVLADLDHFKQINDSFGHQVGDSVLQTFARAAERELRGADRVARWGGEEFLFVLPDTDGQQASICLDRLRSAFLQSNIGGVPSTHRLSFSAGVALCSGPDDIEAAIERADRAMYGAKMAGRNRTNCLEPVPEEDDCFTAVNLGGRMSS